jgi:hypothetical protein
VKGVRLKPGQRAAALFAITAASRRAVPQDCRFRVVQMASGRVVGGSTYLIRGVEEGKPKPAPRPFREPDFPLPERH